jgi:hypothetical protein
MWLRLSSCMLLLLVVAPAAAYRPAMRSRQRISAIHMQGTDKLTQLRNELAAAVQREDYALASTLKEQIEEAEEAPNAARRQSSDSSFRFDTDARQASSPIPDEMEWTPELDNLVLRHMVAAFDNLPPTETQALLVALVAAASSEPGSRKQADAERSLRKLASLARQLEMLERDPGDGREGPWATADEARALRSQLRMWGKDGEKYVPGDTSWLGWLEELRNDI